MEKTQAVSRRYPRNSERAQDDRVVKWRAVDGKLLLNPGKMGVYSSYTRWPTKWVSIRDDTSKPGQVHSRFRHQRRQLADKVQWFEDDVRGPIAVRINLG